MMKITNTESFLAIKLHQILSSFNTGGKNELFLGFYDEFKDQYLKDIFSTLHCTLNDLFAFMNYKNSLGLGEGHFNAEQSRDLIEIIDQLKVIQETLKDENSFEIDDYYKEILIKCKSFLTSNGGSTIPADFPLIDLIEDKPIFTPAQTTMVPGPQLNKSIRVNVIGEGSYAKVFKYKDPHYEIDYAIKRAKPNLRPDELERFRDEYNDLKTLSSPFVIKAYNYNQEKNEYTMEYADQTLSEFIKRNNNVLTSQERKALVIQLLTAFGYIHKKGLLHRDISYHNILVKRYDDGSSLVKVTDFGLVKRPDSTLTRQGTEIKGSINDYSDLMVVGFENYEIRHETYALAKVIYFILTGRTTNYHREQNLELKNFILKAISTNKEERFTNIEDMKEALISKVFPSLFDCK